VRTDSRMYFLWTYFFQRWLPLGRLGRSHVRSEAKCTILGDEKLAEKEQAGLEQKGLIQAQAQNVRSRTHFFVVHGRDVKVDVLLTRVISLPRLHREFFLGRCDFDFAIAGGIGAGSDRSVAQVVLIAQFVFDLGIDFIERKFFGNFE
jgi:hypothetical protein